MDYYGWSIKAIVFFLAIYYHGQGCIENFRERGGNPPSPPPPFYTPLIRITVERPKGKERLVDLQRNRLHGERETERNSQRESETERDNQRKTIRETEKERDREIDIMAVPVSIMENPVPLSFRLKE